MAKKENMRMRHATIRFLIRQRPEILEDIYYSKKFNIYISYNQQDVQPASKIAQFLSKNGMKVLMDLRIEPGEDLLKLTHRTLSRVEYVVILISPVSFHQPWPMPAMDEIISSLSDQGMLRIIPVLIEGCEQDKMPQFLKSYSNIYIKDLSKITLENQLRPLIKGHKAISER
jgi:hypothetical protein